MSSKERIRRLLSVIERTQYEVKALEMEAKALKIFIADRKRLVRELKRKNK